MDAMNGKDAMEAIAKYSAFVEDVLKPQLKESLSLRDAIMSEQTEYQELATLLVELQQQKGAKLDTLMDVGEKFHVRAKIPDTSMITVDVGLNFHVEMTLDEAQAFVQRHLAHLDGKRQRWQLKAKEVSEHVNTALEAIHQLAALHAAPATSASS